MDTPDWPLRLTDSEPASRPVVQLHVIGLDGWRLCECGIDCFVFGHGLWPDGSETGHSWQMVPGVTQRIIAFTVSWIRTVRGLPSAHMDLDDSRETVQDAWMCGNYSTLLLQPMIP